jgi:hypothetical protein
MTLPPSPAQSNPAHGCVPSHKPHSFADVSRDSRSLFVGIIADNAGASSAENAAGECSGQKLATVSARIALILKKKSQLLPHIVQLLRLLKWTTRFLGMVPPAPRLPLSQYVN